MIAAGRNDPETDGIEIPIAAVQLQPGSSLDLAALSAAVATLPEYARPRRVRIVDELPMTDGFRPIKRSIRDLDLSDGPDVLAWDSLAQRYTVTALGQVAGAR